MFRNIFADLLIRFKNKKKYILIKMYELEEKQTSTLDKILSYLPIPVIGEIKAYKIIKQQIYSALPDYGEDETAKEAFNNAFFLRMKVYGVAATGAIAFYTLFH